MKNVFFFFLLLIISLSNVKAQMTDGQIDDFLKTASPKDLVQKNTVLMMDGFFDQSIKIVDQLLEKEPNNSNFNYRKGFAIFSSTSDFSKAIPFFLIGKEKTDGNSDLMSPNEKSAPLEVFFYLGRSYHLVNDINSAKEYYQTYIDTKPKDKNMLKGAFLMLKQCDNAEEFNKTPRNYEILNLGEGINSQYPDYSPLVSLDGSVLYFTSRRLRKDGSNKDIKEPYKNLYNEDVYRSNRINLEEWGNPEVMAFSLPERNEATVAVSSDERSFYIYKDDAGNGDIFETAYIDSQFENLAASKIEGLNTEAWEPHITSSADGRYKYFSSDREGGFGGRDIYRITKLPNGKWSAPMNLGPTINSAYDEDSPFISIDNKTLYFSHNGEKSIGGFDVFISVMNDENQSWSDPINLGVPLNSTGDDIYYTTTANGLTGFYTSFRSDGYGEKDIYEVRNDYLGIKNATVLIGKVISTTNEPIPEDVAFTLKCLNCGQDTSSVIKLRPSDKGFFSTLEKCREYEMVFHYNNGETEFYREKFSTSCGVGFDQTERNIIIDVETMSIIMDEAKDETIDYVFTPLEIKHFFGYNRNKLNPEIGSLKELFDEIIAQVDNGREKFELTVNASASKVPTRTFKNNMELANKRANNIAELLNDYIKNNELLNGKVKVSINKVGVNGTNYKYGTHTQVEKYAPFQYVIIQLDGQTQEDVKIKIIKSKDDELKVMPK